jgi:hypothetical protein
LNVAEVSVTGCRERKWAMAEEANQGSAGEMMILGLIDHADRLGKSAQGTQRALSEQIQELAQLQQWAVNAALEIQKQAGVAIKGLETERGRIQGSQTNLERNAMQAIHDAVEKQSGKIGRQVESALATPLHEIKQAAGQVMQNVKEANRLAMGFVFLLGMVGGLLFGYLAVMRTQSRMDDRLDRIEQFLSTPAQPVSAAPNPPAPAHKGKAK